MKSLCIALPLAAGLFVAGAVLADPRLDEKVYAPYILNGNAELEIRTAGQSGGPTDGTMTTVVEAEYGLNDRVSLAIVTAIERAPHTGARLSSIGIEGVAYLGQIPKLGIDTGLYLEYGHGLNGDSDVLEGKLLFAKTAGRFQGLLNLIVERPLGPKDEAFASYGYAASATWRTVGSLRLGVEALGDLGSDHRFPARAAAYVGPELLWEGRPQGSPVEIDVDAGLLAPVGDDRAEADAQWRFGVELERKF